MVIQVKKDCFCEKYLHELLKYYRPGLVEKKFKVGEILSDPHFEEFNPEDIE
jgi:hypothetical protein